MPAVPEPKHIAQEFKIGNTRVRIATDYCENVSPEEVEKILDRIARRAQQSFIAAAMRENQKQLK